MFTPEASCGASMMPTAISTRTSACRPVESPLASNAASSVASVYVMAAATCTTSAFSPRRTSTSTYCGTSVV